MYVFVCVPACVIVTVCVGVTDDDDGREDGDDDDDEY